MTQQDFETFKLGDWELQSGEKLINASIAYKTFGDPNSPAIVYPTWFSGCMYPKSESFDSDTNRVFPTFSDLG